MATLSTRQAIPVAGQTLEAFFQLQQLSLGANLLRVWVTAAPDKSELNSQIKADFDSRILVYEAQAGDGYPWRFTPDVGGKYILAAQEYAQGTTHGGSYADDPNSYPTLTPVGSTSSLAITVAQRVTQAMGAGEHRAELVCYVLDDAIVKTEVATHGETTPAILPITDTVRVRNAIRDATVSVKLAALEGLTASGAIGSLHTIANNFIQNFNGHLDESGVHENDDDQNAVDNGMQLATVSESGLVAAVSESAKAYRRHITNDDASGNGANADDHHVISSLKVTDYVNATVVQGAADLAGAISQLADLHRCYEAHRVSTALHLVADSTNDLSALSPLLQLHSAFLAVIADPAPASPPATINPGVAELVHGAGFAEKAF